VPALASAAEGRWHTASAGAKNLGDGYTSETMAAHVSVLTPDSPGGRTVVGLGSANLIFFRWPKA